MSLKYNFGKLQDEKRRARGQSFRGGGQMDMGYQDLIFITILVIR